ncbi:MAG: 3-hydroxyacyl-CoA dehydrogenase family protein [FCB group bacterium]|jgi:3-hydroxybutyryl-CoA dehydrogenase|nr:3-hydroxyacyl-CoA dehydrogenase family protein [FCB group bacterium]
MSKTDQTRSDRPAVHVIGAGFMGAGISQVAAQAGHRVTLVDSSRASLDAAQARIRGSLEKLAAKGRLDEAPENIEARLAVTTELRAEPGAEWVIECVYEDVTVKEPLFRELDRLYAPEIVLASNTSGIPISLLASFTSRPERVVGLHFFGPVPIMPPVEVIRGAKTAEATYDRAVDFVRNLGKTPICVRADIPGFIVNRILCQAMQEAIRLVEWGIASPEEVDTALRLALNWQAGPFEIADNAGIDTMWRVLVEQHRLNPNPALAPQPLLRALLDSGCRGRKTGAGFYRYDENGKRAGHSVPVEACLAKEPFADFRL